MKNLFYFLLAVLLFSNCTKDETVNDSTNNLLSLDLRSFYQNGSDEYADFIFSAFYDPTDETSRFSNEVRFSDESTDGDVFFNGTKIPVFKTPYFIGYMNSYNSNPNSTENFDVVCRKSVGKIGNFKASGFNNISDFDIDINIPEYITPQIISNSNGIKISWNIDTKLNNDIFGVLLNYDDGTEFGGLLKSYIFDQNSGQGLINISDLNSVPSGSRIRIYYIRGNTVEKTIDDKLIKAIAYTYGSKTVKKS
ncbi:MAG TPA: hypothetical protein ENK91_13035 [Bacteroidetes bacterium]|nr:hypothetical protein [Bacteroidota bacterium]